MVIRSEGKKHTHKKSIHLSVDFVRHSLNLVDQTIMLKINETYFRCFVYMSLSNDTVQRLYLMVIYTLQSN